MGRWAQRMRRGATGPLPGSGPPSGTVLATNRGSFQGDANSIYPYNWEAFRVQCDVTGNASSLQVVMLVQNCVGWDVRANAYADGAGVPGSLISTGNFRACSGLPGSYTRETFDGLLVPMTAGQFYWFGLENNATNTAYQFWIRAVTIAAGYSANLKISPDGTSWSDRITHSTADFDIVV